MLSNTLDTDLVKKIQCISLWNYLKDKTDH